METNYYCFPAPKYSRTIKKLADIMNRLELGYRGEQLFCRKSDQSLQPLFAADHRRSCFSNRSIVSSVLGASEPLVPCRHQTYGSLRPVQKCPSSSSTDCLYIVCSKESINNPNNITVLSISEHFDRFCNRINC